MPNNQQSLLELALQYLVALNNNQLMLLVLFVFQEDAEKPHQQHELVHDIADLKLLIAADPTIIALEVMLYIYKHLLEQAEKPTAQASLLKISNQINSQNCPPDVENYLAKLHEILVCWQHDPKLSNNVVALLTKIYQHQLIVLEQLFKASTAAQQQLANMAIILNSQIVSMQNLAKKAEQQKKQLAQIDTSIANKNQIIGELENNKKQLNTATKLEQFSVNKLFPALIKKLTHDQAIFVSKHRFMAEEFKIFLHERQNLTTDSASSELAVANIYDLLKRVQLDVVAEMKFGSANG